MIRWKRGLAILLSICMIGGMMPLPVNAEETESQNTVSDNTVQTENAGQTENAVTVTDIAVDTSAASQTLDHYDENGFCRGYEIASDGSGAWVPKSGDDACTDTDCNGYQPMTTVTEDGTTWYEISNAGQLYWFASQVDNGNLLDANVRLTADIVDNEGVTFGWDENNDYAVVATKDGHEIDAKTLRMWNPIGRIIDGNLNYFAGHFDGQGHSISGLYYNSDSEYASGVFAGVLGNKDNYAIVERIGFENSYINDPYQAGGITGYADYAIFRQCYNATYLVSGLWLGGIIAGTQDAYIKLSELYNVGGLKIVGSYEGREHQVGGQILGSFDGSLSANKIFQISSCYGRSDLDISLMGDLSYFDMTDGGLSKNSFSNGKLAYLLSQSSSTWGQDLSLENSLPRPCASDKYPVYKTCTGYTNNASEVHHSIENGFCTNDGCDYYEEPYYNKTDDVYEISNAGQLYAYADKAQTVYTKGAKLTADIVVNKETLIHEKGTPVTETDDLRMWKGLFREEGYPYYNNQKLVFDGNNHSISGLHAKGSGLQGFALHNYGTVRNLQIKNSVFISTDDKAGGIDAGYHNGPADYKVENCSFEGYVEGAAYAGGIVGSGNNISNCYADAYVKGGSVNPIAPNGTITNTAYNTDKYTAECTTSGVQGFTTDQFASGEVAYTLNQGSSEAAADTWRQTLDGETKDGTPTLNTSKENVYQYERLRCDGAAKTTDKEKYAYTNDASKSGKSIPDEHVCKTDTSDHTKHTCSVCGKTEAHTYIYQVADDMADTIQAVCDACGDSYTVKLIAPAGAAGKLTYTGYGLAARTGITDGVLGATLPKIEYATVTDGAVSAYSTDVPVNAGSYRRD